MRNGIGENLSVFFYFKVSSFEEFHICNHLTDEETIFLFFLYFFIFPLQFICGTIICLILSLIYFLPQSFLSFIKIFIVLILETREIEGSYSWTFLTAVGGVLPIFAFWTYCLVSRNTNIFNVYLLHFFQFIIYSSISKRSLNTFNQENIAWMQHEDKVI